MTRPELLLLAAVSLAAGTAMAAPAYPDLAIPVAVPVPMPSAPGDAFSPPSSPGLAPGACAPAIAEWTRSAGPGQSLVVTGTDLSNFGGAALGQDCAFWAYSQTNGGDGTLLPVALQRLGAGQDRALLTLPAALPNGCVMLWPQNSAGLGAPVLLNQTELWWLGPDQAAPGDVISVFGRNFFYNNVPPQVYVGRTGLAFTAVTPLTWNPYKIDLQVPAGLAAGDYQVWVHNGHGGDLGWSGPQTLTVRSAIPWSGATLDVTNATYAGGADPSGNADSWPAIHAALAAAATQAGTSGDATVVFPAGTYSVSQSLIPPSRVRWQGPAAGTALITARSPFLSTCLLGPNNPHSSDNIEIDDLSFSAGLNHANNLPQSGPNNNILMWLRSVSNIHFNRVNLEAVGAIAVDFSNDDHVFFDYCTITGGSNLAMPLYSLVPSQVFIRHSAFYGTQDAAGLMSLSAVQGLCVTDCSGQDLDNSDPNNKLGWGQGRFLYGNTVINSERGIYAGNNTTLQLAPRPGTIGSTGQPDLNAGEQFLWEAQVTVAHGSPLSADADHLTLPGLAAAAAGKTMVGYWELVVVAGRGLGQHRVVIASQGGDTVQVSPPWQVVPDTGSQVILCQALDKCVLYGNHIQGKANYATLATSSVGIEPYGGTYDFIADSNVIQQVRRGINSYSRAETNADVGSIEPAYFGLYQGNQISAVLVGASGIIDNWDASWTHDPHLMYLGNIFRGNSISGAANAGFEFTLGNITAIPGTPMDMNVVEANTIADGPMAISCIGSSTATPLGPQLGSTLFIANSLAACSACGATVPGSQGIVFGAGQRPVLQGNSWARFQSTYAGATPGPLLEAPFRVARAAAFPASGNLVLANAGTAALAWTLTGQAPWLSASPAAGSIPAEGRFTFTYNAAAVTATGLVYGSLLAQQGASSQELLVYTDPSGAGAGIGTCQQVPATPGSGQALGSSYLYPSPARGATARVAYAMPAGGHVRIMVYNAAGRLVDKLEEDKPAGPQTSVLSTGQWAPGVYFYLCTLSPDNGSPVTQPAVKFAVIH